MNWRSKRGGAICGFPCEIVRALMLKHTFRRLIMTGSVRRICEMIGKWSAQACAGKRKPRRPSRFIASRGGDLSDRMPCSRQEAAAVQCREDRFALGRREAPPVNLLEAFHA